MPEEETKNWIIGGSSAAGAYFVLRMLFSGKLYLGRELLALKNRVEQLEQEKRCLECSLQDTENDKQQLELENERLTRAITDANGLTKSTLAELRHTRAEWRELRRQIRPTTDRDAD